jgi:DNA-binding beta-propeller fold protein YncE
MRTTLLARRLPLTLLLFGGSLQVMAQTNWAIEKKLKIGGEGAWDYLTVDPKTHRLFVPRSTHTMVIDADSGKTLGDIPGQKIAHGVAIVPEVGRGFISDGGGDGAVVVFDLTTYAVLGKIVAQPDADGIIFEPASGLVLVVSGDKGVLMSFKPGIDLKSGKIDAPIDLGGAPEFLASDGGGKLYVNLMDKDEVAVVDLKERKVVARWTVAPGGSPVGMSIDTKNGRLFIGCRNPRKLIVMSTKDGKVLSDMPIGETVDATKVENGQVFASCRDGSLSVAGEKSPGKYEIVQVVKTHVGASTMATDSSAHRIYLPAAEFEDSKDGPKGRPKPIAGTFMIVVVAPQGAQ